MFSHDAFKSLALHLWWPMVATVVVFVPMDATTAPRSTDDCQRLIIEARATGFVPKVTVDPNWGIARITTPEKYCREPIEVWNQRDLAWPVEITPNSEAPKFIRNQLKAKAPVKAPAPEPPKAAPVKPRPAPVVAAPKVAKPAPPPKPKPLEIAPLPAPIDNPYVSGTKHPSIISNTGEQPKFIEQGKGLQKDEGQKITPDLANLVRSKMQSTTDDAKGTQEKMRKRKQADDVSSSTWLWTGLSAVFGLGLGVGALFFLRRSSQVKSDEDEDDNEEEEGL